MSAEGPRDVRRSDDEPFDDLTRLAERVMRGLDEEDPEDEVRAILMLTSDDGSVRNCGMQLRGYGAEPEDGAQALRELLHHAGALAEAFGQRIAVLPMGQG